MTDEEKFAEMRKYTIENYKPFSFTIGMRMRPLIFIGLLHLNVLLFILSTHL